MKLVRYIPERPGLGLSSPLSVCLRSGSGGVKIVARGLLPPETRFAKIAFRYVGVGSLPCLHCRGGASVDLLGSASAWVGKETITV